MLLGLNICSVVKWRPSNNNGPPEISSGGPSCFHCQGDRSTFRGCSAVAKFSHRNRKPVRPKRHRWAHRPGHSKPERSSGSGGNGACGSAACGNATCSTWAHSHSSARQRSSWVPERCRRAHKPGHSRSAHSSGSDGNGACGNAACGNATCSTWAHSHSSARRHSTWARRRAHSSSVRAHNKKAHNSHHHHQTGGLPPARQSTQTGRRTAGPATESGISWTELLNRYFRGFHVSSGCASQSASGALFCEISGLAVQRMLRSFPRESLADGYRPPK